MREIIKNRKMLLTLARFLQLQPFEKKKFLCARKKNINLKNYFSLLIHVHHHLIDSFSHHFRYESEKRKILRDSLPNK